jgi:hypothetical protein
LKLPYSNVTLNDHVKLKYNFGSSGRILVEDEGRELVEDDEVYFLLETDAEGYAAIGFGTQMTGADIIIIKFEGTQPPTILDCHGVGETTPVVDTQQDVVLLDYDVTSSPKRVKFKRKLNTNDPKDTILVKGKD